jgi:hypothetical protein
MLPLAIPVHSSLHGGAKVNRGKILVKGEKKKERDCSKRRRHDLFCDQQ